MSYIDNRADSIKKIHNIYNENIPDVIKLFEDIEEINRMEQIREDSGINMTKLVAYDNPCTMLDHCIGVALILDKYTKENKQVISGMLHGINLPVFNESARHMNEKLYEKSVYDVIVGSDKLFEYFLNNNIDIKDVCDYSKYSLAKAKENRMDADSIDNTLRNAYVLNKINEKELKKIYDDLTITKNEDGELEFAFDNYKIAEKFCRLSLDIARRYRSYEVKFSMKIIATLLELMIKRNEINNEDLYKYGDRAIYEIGMNSSDKRISGGWELLRTVDKVYTKFNPVEDKFCVKAGLEVKYVDPLVKLKGGYTRISNVSLQMKDEITQFLNSDTDLYMFGDFVI